MTSVAPEARLFVIVVLDLVVPAADRGLEIAVASSEVLSVLLWNETSKQEKVESQRKLFDIGLEAIRATVD